MLVITLFVSLLSILVHTVFFLYATFNLLCVVVYRRRPLEAKTPNPARVVVIIPVKDDRSILQSLDHILEMDYPNFRVLIMDDSTNLDLVRALNGKGYEGVTVLHREKPIGRKGGAINYALEYLASNPPEYVTIFDADHRPPEDFLNKAVSLAETTENPCIVGWQRHTIGDWGLFGSAYRAFYGATRVNLGARDQMGAGPIFTGSAGLFLYSWLREKGFGHSITEDWELTLRVYLDDGLVVRFFEDLYVDAAIPRGFRWYVRQQVRWTEGTVRDTRHVFWRLLRSPLSWITKAGLLYQGLAPLQTLLVGGSLIITPVAIVFGVGPVFPLWLTAGLLGFYAVSWGSLLARGALTEGYGYVRLVKTLCFAHVLMYVMLPIFIWATLRGLFLENGEWYVTRRRDIEKNHEA